MTRRRVGVAWLALVCMAGGAVIVASAAEQAAGKQHEFALQEADARAAGMDGDRVAQIRGRLREFVDTHKIAGAVEMVARHGRLASFEPVGFADVESQRPMKKDTLFRIASLTKPITCAAVMVLVDAGKLSVIDPVEKWLPEYKGLKLDACVGKSGYACATPLPQRAITIEDLMVHTSGLPAGADGVTERDAAEVQSLADLALLGRHTRLRFEPGSAWGYSNLGYDILGRIVEVAAKQPFETFLEERLFRPLGMRDTTFFPTPAQSERMATLYTQQDDGSLQRAPEQFQMPEHRVPHPAGGLISSAEDMLRFNLMMQNGGIANGHRVLSKAAVELMTVSHTGEMSAGWSPGVGHGYGYEVVRNAEGMFRLSSVGTFQKGGAYRTYEFVDPAKDLAGVLMMQLTNGGGDTADEINSFIAMASAAVE